MTRAPSGRSIRTGCSSCPTASRTSGTTPMPTSSLSHESSRRFEKTRNNSLVHPGVSPNCSAFSAPVGGPSYSDRMTPEDLAAAGLRYAADGAVATITLDRPEVHNAQTPRMWRALAAIGAEITEEVRVVLVRGAGRSFSSGLDRSMLGESLSAMTALRDEEMSSAVEA